MSGESANRLYLLVARPPQIMVMKADGTEQTVLLADAKDTPDGIAVDEANGYIYWTNMGADFAKNDGYIQRMRLDGEEVTTLVHPGETFTPKQLVLDLPNRLMYWSDREGMRVMRAAIDGTNVTVLIQTGSAEADRADETNHCVGIAIDTRRQRIYWTQKGPSNAGKGRIFGAGLALPDGEKPAERTDVQLLFSDPEPIDLELDAAGEYLYWTDRGDAPQGNTLNRAKVDGSVAGPHEMLAGGLQEGIGLAIAEDLQVVFTSDLGGYIRRFDGPEFKSGTVVANVKKPLTGIAYSKA